MFCGNYLKQARAVDEEAFQTLFLAQKVATAANNKYSYPRKFPYLSGLVNAIRGMH